MNLPDAVADLHKGRVLGIVGMPGAGKTEDLMQVALFSPGGVLVLDTVGALTDKLHGRDCYLLHVPKGFDLAETWKVTRELLDRNEKVVWDLRDWMPEEMQELAEALVPRLKSLEGVIVAVDEIQRIVPEFSADLGRGSPAFKDWSTKRRNQPVGLVWTSQRPAFVSMTLRGITDAWIVHRLFQPADLDVVSGFLRRQPGVNVDELVGRVRNQAPGEVVFIDLPFMA